MWYLDGLHPRTTCFMIWFEKSICLIYGDFIQQHEIIHYIQISTKTVQEPNLKEYFPQNDTLI